MEGEGLLLDFTRQRLDAAALQALLEWAAACGLPQRVQDLFAGVNVNHTEDRAALHVALRAGSSLPTTIPADKLALVAAERAKLRAFVAEVRTGRRRGHTGQPFTDVLNIGIGGSDLGPVMAYEALGQVREQLEDRTGRRLRTHFASNIDGTRLAGLLRELDPTTTLVIICSKTFTTLETLTNARLARDWLAAELGDAAVPKHFAAVSTNAKAMDAFGVGADARFDMWDWVGGRTSALCAVGLLPAALQGLDIRGLLAGAKAMDALTRVPDATRNPAAALAAAWHHLTDGMGTKAMVVLPYKDRLLLFSRYLQQLVMESLGKELDLQGRKVNQGLTVYGNKGSTDQHAYVQQLRDGLNNFFAVFIEVLTDRQGPSPEVEPGVTSGAYLQAFFLGTREALAGNGRASITLTIKQVDAGAVGMLIALFERAVGLYASLLGINAYHQPGVEAGKKAAAETLRLRARTIAALAKTPGKWLSVGQICEENGLVGSEELVFKVLLHVSSNPGPVERQDHPDPGHTFFRHN